MLAKRGERMLRSSLILDPFGDDVGRERSHTWRRRNIWRKRSLANTDLKQTCGIISQVTQSMSMLIDTTILLDIPEEANTGCSAGTPVVLDIG